MVIIHSDNYRHIISCDHICGAENAGERFFHGDDPFRDPSRYDIVVFPYKYEKNTYYIKRIIGLPGETVQIVDGYVYIDGQKLDEHYGNEVMENPGIAEEPLVLGDDEYFVLGDNRNNSQDSRAANVGVIHKDDLLGRAWVRIWPLNKFGVIKHE